MSTIENPMVAGLGRHLDRNARKSSLAALAYIELRDEFIKAFNDGPEAEVRTPGATQKKRSIAYVIADDVTDKFEPYLEMLRIISKAARGELKTPQDIHEFHLRASALVASLAHRHADWYGSDLVAEIEEDGQ